MNPKVEQAFQLLKEAFGNASIPFMRYEAGKMFLLAATGDCADPFYNVVRAVQDFGNTQADSATKAVAAALNK